MDTYEAKVLMEDSVRCLARMMEQIRLREIGKVVGDDEPMQDHLAQCVSPVPPYEGMSFEDCMEYLKDLHDDVKSDTMCKHVVAHLQKEAETIIKKHGYKTWADGDYSLPLVYLSTWFRKQYWG